MASKNTSAPEHGRCPICRGKAEAAFRPFCSARCRDVDLARWLGGGYAIPGGQDAGDEDGDEGAPRGTRNTDEDDDGRA
jgi:uncharacterized protein